MTSEQIEKWHIEFENFYAAKYLNSTMRGRTFERKGECYTHSGTQEAWDFWLAAKEQECQNNQWHKVSDGVPYGLCRPQDKVLAINKDGEIYSGYFDGDAEAFCYDGGGDYEDDPEYITHWRKLPEPPKN